MMSVIYEHAACLTKKCGDGINNMYTYTNLESISAEMDIMSTEENSKQFGCPHGYGGPKSNYYTGWFSEMCHIPDYKPLDNWDAYDYIVRRVKEEKYYRFR